MARRARRSLAIAVLGLALTPFIALAAKRPPSADRIAPDYDIRLLTPRIAPALAPDTQALLDELRRARGDVHTKPHPFAPGLRTLSGRGTALTAADGGTPEQVVRRFLARYHRLLGLQPRDLQSLVKLREYKGRNDRLVHVVFEQSADGIAVFGSQLQFHLRPTGEIVGVTSSVVPMGDLPSVVVAADDAVRAAIAALRPEIALQPTVIAGPSGREQRTRFARGSLKSDIDVRLVLFPTASGARLAWAMVLEPPGIPQKYDVLIDAATGELLYRRNRVLYTQGFGRVVQGDATAAVDARLPAPYPTGAAPSGPGDPAGGCPPIANHAVRSLTTPFRDSGTVLGNSGYLEGNNVHVFRGAPNVEGAVGSSQPDGLHFESAFGTPDAAETHLFFVSNFLHDFFYDLGFDEPSGNFQVNNFGRGGVGGDSLVAVARADGRNNATFEPNPDGQPSIMSMFLWDGLGCWSQDVDGDGAADLDGDFDSDIIIHEFHHGVSHRLNTQFTGIEADAIGEGGSDFFAYSINGDTTLSAYSYPPSGIRSVNGKTYGDWFCFSFFGLVLCLPHDNGEIWANTLWDLRERFREDVVGGSNAAAINESHQLYVDGLKLSPPSPTMLDLRDAMLLADTVRHPSADPGGSQNHCRLWEVFATRGMAYAAQDTDDTGTVSVVEDFTVGPECPALAPPAPVTVTASPTTASEAGTQAGGFVISRSGDMSRAITVYFTVAGTAVAGSDYAALPGNVQINAGATSATVPVTPIDDATVENNETVTITLTGSVGYALGSPSAATVTILSDDVAPDLVVSALTVPAAGGAGVAIAVSATTKNQGSGAATASTTRYYLSLNASLDAAVDTALGTNPIPALSAGASSVSSATLTIPAGTATGTYYVLAQADADSTNVETSEANNVRSAMIRVGPDMTVPASAAPTIAAAGSTITLTDTTKNNGAGSAPASITKFYLSTNAGLDAADIALGTRSVPVLAAGASHAGSATVMIPASTATGTYYILTKTDGDDAMAETNETNNVRWVTTQVGPDLVVSAGPTVTGVLAAGGTITISDTTKNQGASGSADSVTRSYLSTNTALDAADVLLGGRAVGPLAAGATSAGAITVTIPAATAAGSYYVISQADGTLANVETNETNNDDKTVVVKVGPDLYISALTGPAIAAAGSAIAITDTTKNQGGGSAAASMTRFFFSTNTSLDAGDTPLGTRAVPALAAAATHAATTSLVVPSGLQSGTYYILALADADASVAESVETNNVGSVSIRIGPDLIISTLSAAGLLEPGGTFTVTETTKNAGASDADTSSTRFYLSTNSALDASDTLVGERAVPVLAAGATQAASTVLTVPATTAAGLYYLLAQADGDGNVLETIETNNVSWITVRVGADLILTSISLPSSVPSGGTVTVTDTTKNQAAPASNTSATKFYLSTNIYFDANDTLLGARQVAPLAPGVSSTGTTSVTIPTGLAPGTYYMIGVADGDNGTPEGNEGNNTLWRAFTLTAGS